MPRVQTVLIVEDSYLLLEIVASLCETQGVRVAEASTGEAALTILRAQGAAIDWLFTDINLPGLIDGWSVAQAFRAIHPHGPVVYTSTESTRTDAAMRARGVPGSLFLRKPFQVREVEQVVRSMAQGRADRSARRSMRAAG